VSSMEPLGTGASSALQKKSSFPLVLDRCQRGMLRCDDAAKASSSCKVSALQNKSSSALVLYRRQRGVLQCDDAAKASSNGRVKRLAEEEQISAGTRQMPARCAATR
jgi:hypothetical protein